MEETLAVSGVKSVSVVAAGSLLLLLSACGGSESSSESSTAETARDDAAAQSSTGEAEPVVTEASVADAVDEAKETMNDVGTKVANVTEDAIDNAEAAVENAVADASEKVDAVAASTDVASEYAALTGDPAKGRRVFAKCMACHTVQEGQNRVGPSLYGIVGQSAGSIDGFSYTDANAKSGITWTEETMFAYLKSPQEFIPGTRMIFAGLPSAQERADVIAYLKSAAE